MDQEDTTLVVNVLHVTSVQLSSFETRNVPIQVVRVIQLIIILLSF